MDKHKAKALEEKCLCGDCPNKFGCFTQERIFSDSIFQGLFEALMAEGYTKENALSAIEQEIKSRIGVSNSDYTVWATKTVFPSVTYTDSSSDGYVGITYTMVDGKEVSWTCTID